MNVGEGLRQFFMQSGLGFGAVDILCLGPFNVDRRILSLVATLLGARDERGRSPIHQFVIVVPAPVSERVDGLDPLKRELEKLLVASTRFNSEEVATGDHLRMVVPPDLEVSSALSSIQDATPRSVVIVANASSFRDVTVDVFSGNERPKTSALPEDIWAPQLHAFGKNLAFALQGTEIYGILDAGQLAPRRPALVSLLKSIDNVGVLGSEMKDDPNRVFEEREEDWNRWLSQGRLGAVFRSIDELPPPFEQEIPFLKIQILHRAKLHGQALAAIEELPADEEPDPFVKVKLAKVSADAGAALQASKFLSRAVDELDLVEGLELALVTAQKIGYPEIEERIASRLERLFPSSPALQRKHIQEFVAEGDFEAAAAALSGISDAGRTEELLTFLSETLGGSGIPDYTEIGKQLSDTRPPWIHEAKTALLQDAVRRGLVVHALTISFSIGEPSDWSQRDAELVLDIIDMLLLDRNRPGGVGDIDDFLKSAVMGVVRFLSTHSNEGAVRVRLTRLLSVNVSASVGVPLIASATLEFARIQPSPRRKRINGGLTTKELLARSTSLEGAFEWLRSESPLWLGRAILPAEHLSGDPDALLPAITRLLQLLGSQISDDDDVDTLLTWLALGVSIAPHSSEPDEAISMIRIVAGFLAVSGRVQQARDMAEHALSISGSNPRRQRMAWFAMADVYHRLGNNLEGFVALACTLAGDQDVDQEELFTEVYCLVRLLRDVGLLEFAREVHERIGGILRRLGLYEDNQHEHEHMGLQIDMALLLQSEEHIPANIPGLLERSSASAEEALARHYNLLPAAALLGQLVLVAEKFGVNVSAKVGASLDALQERMGESNTILVRAISSKHPDAEDVLFLHNRIETARYSDDVGYDVRYSVLAARRLLDSADAVQDSEVAALAIELLADRAIAAPGWEATAEPVPTISRASEPVEMAKRVSAEGVSVVLAGIDASSRLVAVIATAGGIDSVHREGREVFSVDHYRSWTEEFPLRYGIDEQAPNLFHLSTDRLGISNLPDSPVLLVADTELQQLPPNLLRQGDRFAGQMRAMAMVPSLSWITAAWSRPAKTNGRRAAWISAEDQRGPTLAMIIDRLEPTLAEHSIELDSGAELPTTFAYSELVVLAAHGSVSSEGRFFYRVSDEGILTVTAGELASALRNVGVVVLFVCSGGRTDKHPMANTTVGLAKELLDRGCSTVVASSWPLDSRVTYHWLPAFLEEWTRDVPVVEACYIANLTVAEAFGGDLSKQLAMTVFGDPLRTQGQ